MHKKEALVTLIEASFLLSSDEKLMLLDSVPAFTDKQVDTVGTMLARERALVLANEQPIKEVVAMHLEPIAQQHDTVYVGEGKAE